MAKKKKDQKVQKNLQITNATFAPPPYERVSLKSNTEDFQKHKSKNKCVNSNLCLCHDSGQPKTWQSIANMYGDQETTEIWNNNDQKPVPLSNPSRWRNTYKKERNKYEKKSKGLYYKHNEKRKKTLHNDNVVKDEHPIIDLKLKKKQKSKKNPVTQPNATGDSCIGGPCRTSLPLNYNPQKGGKKQDGKKESKANRTDVNVHKKDILSDIKGQGDRTIPSAIEKKESKSPLCNFIRKLKNLASTHKVNSKIPNIPVQREPMFEMKVDSEKMRVLNPLEVQRNVRKFGTLEQKQCICPSRLSTSKNVCNRGICERALIQKNGRFKCKCGDVHSVECKDTTCNSKNKSINKNSGKSSKYESQNNPLFEVMIDSNMTVLNSHEIKDILADANSKICPTGICNVAAKKNMNLNCKCLNKKITPNIMECTHQTCQPDKRCKLFHLCSRICSKSENFIGNYQETSQLKRRKGERESRKIKTSSYNRNSSRVPKEREDQVDFCKCYCECDELTTRERHKNHKSKKLKSKRDKKVITNKHSGKKPQNHRIGFREQQHNLTAMQSLMKCLRRKRKRCEKQIKEMENEYEKNERELEKQHQREYQKQQITMKEDAHNWNCLTRLVSGLLNLLIKSVINIFSSIFSLFFNPIRSYVYIKERAKNPERTLRKFGQWVSRTWSNRTSKLSQTVKESNAMGVIADQIESLPVYETLFANKGTTQKERVAYERQRRLRQKRIKKRHEEALYGCRHMILTTMRKTPCLWFYFICPDMYPQCLGLISFMRNFFHLIIYLIAFICWTPCIISFELCRSFLCCLLCTH